MVAWELHLLGSWELLRDGTPLPIGRRQQRLVASLALMGSRPRSYLAGLLWPESSEHQAAGNLRSSVFKLRHQLPDLLDRSLDPLRLADGIIVDLDRLRWVAQKALSGGLPGPGAEDLLFGSELLPGWYDDWVMYEQERLRGLRVLALEAIARSHLATGNYEAAISAARYAAALEPLRESAHKLISRAQTDSGSRADAQRTLLEFRRRLWTEMGVAPAERQVVNRGPAAARPQAGWAARAGASRTER
ncbi:AfsR/SARP family transcriptional regulator [Sinomonas soli]